jgi:hypothetical protein
MDSKIFTDSNGFKNLKTLTDSKITSPPLQKCEIKYGWKVFEIRINFPYRNFSRFEMEFESKF